MNNYWTDRQNERIGAVADCIAARWRERLLDELDRFLEDVEIRKMVEDEVAHQKVVESLSETDRLIADLEAEMEAFRQELELPPAS